MANRYTLPLVENYCYHVYNQGNNGETLFYMSENYEYFLKKLEEYFCSAVVYIHQNPMHHRYYKDFRNYPWSSYNKIIDESSSLINKYKVIKYFGNIENHMQS